MLKDITIGQYFPGDTFVHKLDPRIKILISIMFIISLFFIKDFYPYALIFAFIIFSIILSKIPIRFILKGLKPLMLIIIITFLINVFLTKGEVLYTLGPLTITKEGLSQAVFMALRLIFLITGTSLLTLTTSPISLTDGIESLLSPFKKIGLPAHELAMMMTIALRFIPTLLEETDKIMKAQMARGADFESGNVINRAKNLVPLLVPLFVNAFRRADELAIAMEARCYRGGEHRTRLNELSLDRDDAIALISSIIFFGFIISTKYINYI
ncbi:MAG: energy-coupling factor transporter transmembrane protein EcfT [Tissierellia bacterium]|nr:energy-coupling factor transporter transmembrane protein EcfT [Tissierellia bacterium]